MEPHSGRVCRRAGARNGSGVWGDMAALSDARQRMQSIGGNYGPEGGAHGALCAYADQETLCVRLHTRLDARRKGPAPLVCSDAASALASNRLVGGARLGTQFLGVRNTVPTRILLGNKSVPMFEDSHRDPWRASAQPWSHLSTHKAHILSDGCSLQHTTVRQWAHKIVFRTYALRGRGTYQVFEDSDLVYSLSSKTQRGSRR